MHYRPTAEALTEAAKEKFSSRFLHLSHEPDPLVMIREKFPEQLKWCEEQGGKQAKRGRDLYCIGNRTFGRKGLRLRKKGLFIKTAGLVFQNPHSGLRVEATQARRARHDHSADDSVFESPRYRNP
jgi:hypothetical protein